MGWSLTDRRRLDLERNPTVYLYYRIAGSSASASRELAKDGIELSPRRIREVVRVTERRIADYLARRPREIPAGQAQLAALSANRQFWKLRDAWGEPR